MCSQKDEERRETRYDDGAFIAHINHTTNFLWRVCFTLLILPMQEKGRGDIKLKNLCMNQVRRFVILQRSTLKLQVASTKKLCYVI